MYRLCILNWKFCFEINTALRTTWWVTLYTHPTIGHIFIYNGIHSFGSKILLQVSLKLLLPSISAMVYGSAAVNHQTFRRLKCHLLQKLLTKSCNQLDGSTCTILVFPNWKNGPTSSRVRGAKKASNLEEFPPSPILHHPSSTLLQIGGIALGGWLDHTLL